MSKRNIYRSLQAYLSKTHLIGQDTVYALFVESCQPVKTLELILFESRYQHVRLLNRQFSS